MRQSDRRSGLPKIEKIHLPEKHMVLRVVLLTAAIIVAAVSLISGLTGLLNQQPGWQEIEAQTKEKSYSQEFTLRYDLGGRGASATVENKALSDLLSESMERGYEIFDPEAVSDTVHNLRFLSDHPNEVVELDPVLYGALEKVKAADSRLLYLAPAYIEQSRIFRADTPEQAMDYDPARDPELKGYLQQCADFARDPMHIDLTLHGENRAELKVSEEYLRFAEENEITCLLDFSWTRNAFLCDWIADQMAAQGYTLGIIASADGFTRNLDPREDSYAMNLFARSGNEVNVPGALQYQGPMSLVHLRNYPLSPEEGDRYAVYPDGRVASRYLSPEDGLCHPGLPELLVYDRSLGCADLALAAAEVYLNADLVPADVTELPGEAVWTEGKQIRYTKADAEFTPGVNADQYGFTPYE